MWIAFSQTSIYLQITIRRIKISISNWWIDRLIANDQITNLARFCDNAFNKASKSSKRWNQVRCFLFVVRQNSQYGKYFVFERHVCCNFVHAGYQLLKVWIWMIKSAPKQHVYNNIGHTRRDQVLDVESTSWFCANSVNHLFHFHQDPCLHHALTESKPFQNGQTQLMMLLERRRVMSTEKSLTDSNSNVYNKIIFNIDK